MQLTMLGTGNAMVTKCYNTCFALRDGEDVFLVDAGGGNGILRQMELAQLPFAHVRGMFLTHGHTDHILGAIWVVRKIASLLQKGAYAGEFPIRCHAEAAAALQTLCALTLAPAQLRYLGEGIRILPVAAGEAFEALGMAIRPFDILSTKLRQYGFSAQLPDGKRLTCLGDEPYNPAADARAEGSDWLLAEAFCLHAQQARFRPYEKHHSTARDAGRVAQALGVKNLVLYHTEDETLATRKQAYSAEAAEAFGGRIFVPDDLETIAL